MIHIQGMGMAISSQRLIGDSSGLHFPPDQLPDLDDERVAKLKEKIDKNQSITCLTPDKIAQINEISIKKEGIEKAFACFLQKMRGNEELYDQKTQRKVKDLEQTICQKH